MPTNGFTTLTIDVHNYKERERERNALTFPVLVPPFSFLTQFFIYFLQTRSNRSPDTKSELKFS